MLSDWWRHLMPTSRRQTLLRLCREEMTQCRYGMTSARGGRTSSNAWSSSVSSSSQPPYRVVKRWRFARERPSPGLRRKEGIVCFVGSDRHICRLVGKAVPPEPRRLLLLDESPACVKHPGHTLPKSSSWENFMYLYPRTMKSRT